MARYLIVANQTMGGAELERKIKDRIDIGGEFYVVVPMIEPEDETSSWMPHDPAFGIGGEEARSADAMEEARRRSEHRLARMVSKIESLGGEVDGEVGGTDPLAAARTAIERETFNEVIVSTLPAGISRWLKMDLPSRIDRLVDCPVTTVEADGG